MSSRLLQIFAKAPILGKVKTRLAKDIGDEQACNVYQSLLFNTVKSTHDESWKTELWCAPDSQHPALQSLSKQYALSLETQCQGDLGERMLFALQAGKTRANKVVLIGSDCPVISVAYIQQAFNMLDTKDIVFGPVEDGGYLLIACKSTHVHLFEKVKWSCADTLLLNIKAVEKCRLSYGLLDTLWDLDNLEDLKRLLS